MKKDILFEVIDDFLDPRYFEVLKERLIGGDTPWYATQLVPRKDCPNMSHDVIGEGMDMTSSNNTKDIVIPMLCMVESLLDTHGVIKCRLESYTRTNETDHEPHIDACANEVKPKDFKTIIFSFADCGTTTIYNETYKGRRVENFTVKEVVESKPNRLIMIDGDRYHSGPKEIPCARRVVLNANFYTKKQHAFNNGERM
jgi:hypothetical protein